MRMLTHRIPAVLIPLAILIGVLGTVLLLRNTNWLDAMRSHAGNEMAKPTAIVCTYNLVRRSGMPHVKPLLYAEQACESPRFRALKLDIDALVNEFRAAGVLNSASVYLRDTQRGEWMSYNDAETYDPGSMLKVPTLMAWLDMAEADPGLLERRYTLAAGMPSGNRAPVFPGATIEEGKPYTVSELLTYMVVHSDNRATGLLNRNVDLERMLKVFSELGLERPAVDRPVHPMTARDFSVFMKALYNATYLSPAYSEMAMEMLTRSTFSEGLRAGLPADLEMAHKFGEGGDQRLRQLHETAILYLGDTPYLLTVMTKGRDLKELTGFLEQTARLVHGHLAQGGVLRSPA
ncbi:MAG: serine hydrolase [Flavobacteriales bacterium]|nr:serine hydrolase [Flavobacteriales bacterium]